jgi:hypothetical protein
MTWITDVLPDDHAVVLDEMMDAGARAIRNRFAEADSSG